MGFHESCARSTTARIDMIRDIQYELLDRAEPIVYEPAESEYLDGSYEAREAYLERLRLDMADEMGLLDSRLD